MEMVNYKYYYLNGISKFRLVVICSSKYLNDLYVFKIFEQLGKR